MAKNKTADMGVQGLADVVDTAMVAETPTATNFTLTYRRDHPGDRCSYGIDGVPGIVVFDKGLFLDATAPATIEVNVALQLKRVKVTKADESAAKAQAKLEKEQAKVLAAQKKIEERKAKADDALLKAKAKADAALAKLNTAKVTNAGTEPAAAE